MDQYFNVKIFLGSFPQLLERVPYTLGIVLASFLIGCVAGTVLTCLYRIHSKALRALVTAYVWLMRGTPLLLLLFISYYGLPMALSSLGLEIDSDDPLAFVLVAFSMSLSAFFAEMMRAAFEAVDAGQIEAAQSLGLHQFTYYRRIVIPQALINSLPNFGNLLVTAIKQSSILFTIGIMDVYERAITISAEDFGLWQLEVFLALLVIYWVIAVVVDKSIALLYRSSLKKVA